MDGPRLELKYPCEWEYRVIGADEAQLRAAIEGVLGDRPAKVTPGRSSTGGKWVTLVVALEVASEEDRLQLYEALRGHEAVKIVL
ncbi:MAG: DUF493 domain-containing protein [Phycisphaerales bacterium]|nr:DUF493 domain-containing protein [Phycisphaerales bacterium]